MSDRPTPEQIAALLDQAAALHPDGWFGRTCREVADSLDGYVIVHPEATPRQSYDGPYGRQWAIGYNQARRDIFGEAAR